MRCHRDTRNHAIPTIKGKDIILDGPYRNRKHAIAKCAVAARTEGGEGGPWANYVYTFQGW